MTMEVVPYSDEFRELWDAFCDGSINSTFLHTRRFLSYHKQKFNDISVLLRESDDIVGLFPAAVSPDKSDEVISHPGATYGGIIHQGKLTGKKMIDAMTALCGYYKDKSFKSLLYKSIPHIYQKSPAQDDGYALFVLEAARTRCDLSCTIDLGHRLTPSSRRKRSLKKAQDMVTISDEPACLESLWTVIVDNLDRKHNVQPVHTLEEIKELIVKFPNEIRIVSALVNGKIEAGVVLFNSMHVWHAQYIASSETGYRTSALDAVFEHIIMQAEKSGARYFDFGTSNESGGKILNEGLFRFKSEFGGGGVAHEFWKIRLD